MTRALLLAGLLPCLAAGAPNEIKVFTDELAAYREHTLEVHANRGDRTRFMPEYSYGLWRQWEVSVQLPFAWSDGLRSEGYRAELQYIAPHGAPAGFYWGVNAELARIERLGEEHFWNAELIPIAGWRGGAWHVVANPGASLPLSGSERKASFDPALKTAYSVAPRSAWGIEYYSEGEPRERTLYLAWDGKLGRSDVNAGVGRVLSGGSERWVVKTIFEIAF
jgi:hypothetical protein